MADLAVALPIVLPLSTAILCLFAWTRPAVQRFISTLGGAALLGSAVYLLRLTEQRGICATQVGSWPAPFGITLVADLLSAIMVVLNGAMGFAVGVYSLAGIDRAREAHGFHALFHVLLMGVSGSFLTGDIFNLFVWFEVMLISSFVLIALGGERAQLDGATKYVTLNLLSSTLFLSSVGILYGATGTLNMADLVGRLQEVERPQLVVSIGVMFLVSFGIKAALFPLFFWLPASYHTPPLVVSAIFAGLLTKVGVYALLRIFTLLFTQDVSFTHPLIILLSALTMITGVLGAAAQSEIRRILSFHIVSQIGYMTMGLGLFTHLAIAGSIFYIVHHVVVKTNLFLVSGVVRRLHGSYQLEELGGVYREQPWLAALFLVPALSLAGVPPLSGFWAKLFLIKAGLDAGQWMLVTVALVVGLLTLYSMTKIWNEAFWRPRPAAGAEAPLMPELSGGERRRLVGPIVALAAVTLLIGLCTAPFFELSLRAAEQLLDPSLYVAAVLEARR
jgi:multicomponent Na+:H+ antiporter subunit D